MNGVEITIFVLVSIAAIPLMNWAWKYSDGVKLGLEEEALVRLKNDLKQRGVDPNNYKILLIIFKDPIFVWNKQKLIELDFEKMTEIIAGNVTQRGGGHTLYRKAKYSINIDTEKMLLHFVVGINNFDFSEALHTHNKPIKRD
jgi:hypothetical protein